MKQRPHRQTHAHTHTYTNIGIMLQESVIVKPPEVQASAIDERAARSGNDCDDNNIGNNNVKGDASKSPGAGRLQAGRLGGSSTGGGGGQVLKCPRCDSLNTKFCYYNNYSLAQPRHFCKNCRRYWTHGGMLRNIPVGGGCRKSASASTAKARAAAVSEANFCKHSPHSPRLDYPFNLDYFHPDPFPAPAGMLPTSPSDTIYAGQHGGVLGSCSATSALASILSSDQLFSSLPYGSGQLMPIASSADIHIPLPPLQSEAHSQRTTNPHYIFAAYPYSGAQQRNTAHADRLQSLHKPDSALFQLGAYSDPGDTQSQAHLLQSLEVPPCDQASDNDQVEHGAPSYDAPHGLQQQFLPILLGTQMPFWSPAWTPDSYHQATPGSTHN